ncbi:MAG: S-layer homology domain-containing protein [Clostridia bacterium]|nr:S-layer homology domain-containing protein [Clostridia bacterium]
MKKRIIAALLAAVLLLGSLPVAFAEETEWVNTSEVFKDVSKKDWFYKNGAIDYVYNNGLFSGTAADTFGPEENMTRAMFVTVLGRLEGCKVSINKAVRFMDVKKNQYYTGYVHWAADNGIVSGVSDADFGPDENITREQICAMLVRYCEYAKVTLEEVNDAVTFTDAKEISKYARSAVKICQKGGLVNGEKVTEGYRFRPKGNATRAEVATILMNFAKRYADIHIWMAGEPVTEGCITTTEHTCAHCAEIKTVTFSAHTFKKTAAVAATCKKTGKTAAVSCSACGEVFAVANTTPKVGHSYQAATCATAKTCKYCGVTSGAPLGHNMSGGVCTRCRADGDPHAAAGFAVAALFVQLNPSQEMYIKSVRYVNGCKASSSAATCSNAAYTFYITYSIGENGSSNTAYVGMHLDDSYFYVQLNHKGNTNAANGTALNVDTVLDYAYYYLNN